MAKGTVKWFNSQKGYGFIQPQTRQDVFVYISAVERAGLSGLNEGQVVEYEEVANKGNVSRKPQGSALILAGHCRPITVASMHLSVSGLPGATAPSAQERNNSLYQSRLVNRWPPFCQ